MNISPSNLIILAVIISIAIYSSLGGDISELFRIDP